MAVFKTQTNTSGLDFFISKGYRKIIIIKWGMLKRGIYIYLTDMYKNGIITKMMIMVIIGGCDETFDKNKEWD